MITKRRTLVSDAEQDRNGCKNHPLLDNEPDNIIPDELHLLLQITNVMTENLIIAAGLHDKRQQRGCKLLDRTMIRQLLENIKSCGVSLKIWEAKATNKEFDFTLLMGNCKKKMLDKLLLKFNTCQPPSLAEDATELWNHWHILFNMVIFHL